MAKWKNSKRAIPWMICILLPLVVIGALGCEFFGTMWGGADKVAWHLEEKINVELQLKGVMVVPNKPKYGDVTVKGQVSNQNEKANLTKLAADWSDFACKIHVDVKIKPHNKKGLEGRQSPFSQP